MPAPVLSAIPPIPAIPMREGIAPSTIRIAISTASDSIPVVAIPKELFATIIHYPGLLISTAYLYCATGDSAPAVTVPAVDAIASMPAIGADDPAVTHICCTTRHASPATTIPTVDSIMIITITESPTATVIEIPGAGSNCESKHADCQNSFEE